MMATARSLTENLFGTDRPETRGERIFFRVFEAVVVGIAVYVAWQWAFYIPRIAELTHPEGIARYVDLSFLLVGGRARLLAGALSGLAVVGFLRLWRGAYLGVFLLLHVQCAARFSLGKIEHGTNFIGMALLALALATLAFRAPGERRRFALGFTVFFVGLSYPLAAFSKLVGTGITWPDGRHLGMWMHEKGIDALAKTGATDLNALQQLTMDHWGLATAFLVGGLLTELSGGLFWWRRFRLPVGLALIGLHVGIDLVMGIRFLFSIVLLVLLTFPWARWVDAWLAHSANAKRTAPSP